MNWEAIIIAAIAAFPPTLVGAAALWQAIKTHGVVNHKMDEMLTLARKEGKAQGKLDEKADQRARDEAKPSC